MSSRLEEHPPPRPVAPVPVTAPSSPDDGLFPWTIVEALGDPPELGAVGVCSDRDRALRKMVDALRTAPPGAFGLLHKVALSPDCRGYRYSGPLLRVAIGDRADAVVMVEHEGDGGGRMRPGDIFAEIVRDARVLCPEAAV